MFRSGQNSLAELQQKLSQLTTQPMPVQELLNQVIIQTLIL